MPVPKRVCACGYVHARTQKGMYMPVPKRVCACPYPNEYDSCPVIDDLLLYLLGIVLQEYGIHYFLQHLPGNKTNKTKTEFIVLSISG